MLKLSIFLSIIILSAVQVLAESTVTPRKGTDEARVSTVTVNDKLVGDGITRGGAHLLSPADMYARLCGEARVPWSEPTPIARK